MCRRVAQPQPAPPSWAQGCPASGPSRPRGVSVCCVHAAGHGGPPPSRRARARHTRGTRLRSDQAAGWLSAPGGRRGRWGRARRGGEASGRDAGDGRTTLSVLRAAARSASVKTSHSVTGVSSRVSEGPGSRRRHSRGGTGGEGSACEPGRGTRRRREARSGNGVRLRAGAGGSAGPGRASRAESGRPPHAASSLDRTVGPTGPPLEVPFSHRKFGLATPELGLDVRATTSEPREGGPTGRRRLPDTAPGDGAQAAWSRRRRATNSPARPPEHRDRSPEPVGVRAGLRPRLRPKVAALSHQKATFCARERVSGRPRCSVGRRDGDSPVTAPASVQCSGRSELTPLPPVRSEAAGPRAPGAPTTCPPWPPRPVSAAGSAPDLGCTRGRGEKRNRPSSGQAGPGVVRTVSSWEK